MAPPSDAVFENAAELGFLPFIVCIFGPDQFGLCILEPQKFTFVCQLVSTE